MRHHVAISDDKWSKLSTLRDEFNKHTGIEYSHGEFFLQAVAYFVGDITMNRVDTVRLNRYVYGAYCMKCNEVNMLLGKVIVWYVTCEKCGHEFMASRRP